ncbi:MAG: HAD hydrolase-like protein [Bacteroidota bacterium]|nr:HAD hydrolase-like protein [Bacteroidota bacterium]
MKDIEIKAIIFDLDGTLADSIEDIGDAMNRVLQQNGFPVHTAEQYKYFVGRGLRNLVIEALPEKERDEEMIEKLNRAMMDDYGKNYLVKTKTYEGIREVVSSLKKNGFKMGVLSNKADEMTQKVVTELFPAGTFDIVLGMKADMTRKPDPRWRSES